MSKNIQMQEKTSSGYDILYPQTIAAQIEDVYSKDETITTATKALYGLGATATPNQVFSAISTALDGKARIQTGSYVGTGTYGASNPCSLTFNLTPKLFVCMGNGATFASNSSADVNPILCVNSITELRPRYDNHVQLSWYYNQIRWYSDFDAGRQLNAQWTTYYYCVVGS